MKNINIASEGIDKEVQAEFLKSYKVQIEAHKIIQVELEAVARNEEDARLVAEDQFIPVSELIDDAGLALDPTEPLPYEIESSWLEWKVVNVDTDATLLT